MTFIQICRSFCKSVLIYVIAKVGLKIGVDLKTRTSFSSSPKKPNLKEPMIMEYGALTDPLLFIVVLLFCTIVLSFYTIVSLGVKTLFG